MAFKVAMTGRGGVSAWEREALEQADAQVVAGNCTTEEELLALAGDADAILAATAEPLNRRVIEKLEHCRVIARYGVGLDNVDIQAATDNGIVVAYVPDASVDEVSDHAMALLLACARKLIILNDGVKAGKWAAGNNELAIKRRPMFKLRGQVLGIVGLSRIGSAVVPKAKGFGLRVIAYDPYQPASVFESLGVEPVDFERLLTESDFISLHTALTPETEGMFGIEQFRKMKPTAFLINTGRGPLVDEAALFEACSTGLIAGAGTDVLISEPPGEKHPLFGLENVIITPHSAYYSETAGFDIIKRPLDDVIRVLKGELPIGFVNPQVVEKLTWLKK
jgi:D-3-phosphoglycerate dehydrogenase